MALRLGAYSLDAELPATVAGNFSGGHGLSDGQLELDIFDRNNRPWKLPYILSRFGKVSANASQGRRSGQKRCTLGENMSGLCRLVTLMYVVPGEAAYFMPS